MRKTSHARWCRAQNVPAILPALRCSDYETCYSASRLEHNKLLQTINRYTERAKQEPLTLSAPHDWTKVEKSAYAACNVMSNLLDEDQTSTERLVSASASLAAMMHPAVPPAARAFSIGIFSWSWAAYLPLRPHRLRGFLLEDICTGSS